MMVSFLMLHITLQCCEKTENKTVLPAGAEQQLQEMIKLRKENEGLRETIHLMNLLQELPKNEREKLEIIFFNKRYDFFPTQLNIH